MLTHERKRLIAEKLRLEGRLVAKAFANELELSEDTIRKDLREMAADGLLTRVHGGALPISPDLPDFATRTSVATQEKRALGKNAAALITPGQTIFIDGGTTNAELVRALPRHFEFTVATHSPTIAAGLESVSNVHVILIGGKLYRHSMVAVGTEAVLAILKIQPDIFFMGVTGLHAHHGFTTGDYEEAAIKRAICMQSKETWVLATASKLDAVSPVTIVPLSDVKGIVMADQPSDPWRGIFSKAELNVVV